MIDDLLELVAMLVGALDAAENELASLREMDHVPLPDELHAKLEERLVLIETLKRVRGGLKAGAALDEAKLTAVYREERSRHPHVEDSLPPAPVLGDVERELADVQEVVRRRALVLPALDHALRGVPLREDFAGC